MLDIIANYHCMKFQEKHMIQNQANGEKLHYRNRNSGCQFFFFFSEIWLRQSIDIMVRYQRVKYQKKTNNTILRKFNNGQTDGQTDRQIDKQQE